MRVAPLVLALAFAGLQSLSWIDCCCGSLCTRPNDVCEDCAHPEEPAAEKACCRSGEDAPKAPPQACLHVHPQEEVEAHVATALPDPDDAPPLPAAPFPARLAAAVSVPDIAPRPPRLCSPVELGILLN